jgi:hypothetical protein
MPDALIAHFQQCNVTKVSLCASEDAALPAVVFDLIMLTNMNIRVQVTSAAAKTESIR